MPPRAGEVEDAAVTKPKPLPCRCCHGRALAPLSVWVAARAEGWEVRGRVGLSAAPGAESPSAQWHSSPLRQGLQGQRGWGCAS